MSLTPQQIERVQNNKREALKRRALSLQREIEMSASFESSTSLRITQQQKDICELARGPGQLSSIIR